MGQPVAIVAGLDLNGLGVVRSLGRAGVPVVALDTDLGKPTCATRYARKLRVAALGGEAFVAALLDLRRGLDADPVLLLTQEGSVATVSAQRRRLESGFRFSLPEHDLLTALLDKLGFQALAERHGAPIPRAARLGTADDAAAIRGLRYPCVLKPTTKDPAWALRFKKAYRVDRADDVAALWTRMRGVVAEVIVQEWIEGGDADVFFCLQYRPRSGAPATSFVGRKVRQWPPLVGGTACCVPAPEAAAELTRMTDAFFDAVGFFGVGSMEFKRDRRDNRFYMVEPTVGRTDYQEEVATLNGVNIPLAAYLGELGLSAPAGPARSRAMGWRDPISDGNARQAGATTPDGACFADAYFRLGDPMPYVTWKAASVRQRLRARRPAPVTAAEPASP